MSNRITVLNGPNLNLLGQRQPEIYGHETLADVKEKCRQVAADLGLDLRFEQSNHEGQIVDWIHEARGIASAVIVNAGAYTHTSIALLDALRAFAGLKVELHLSNPAAREEFRHHSYVALGSDAVIAGLGPVGYEVALTAVARKLEG